MITSLHQAIQHPGRPFLAINAMTYWHAVRQCGIEDRVYGHGSVLEEF
jgi:maleate isomerase